MRMWMIPPRILCTKHLLGEHVECHMFVGTINKKVGLDGYLAKGLLEVHNLIPRHKMLVKEMERRGYNHKSPLPSFPIWREGKIDRKGNLVELVERCPNCLIRYLTAKAGGNHE